MYIVVQFAGRVDYFDFRGSTIDLKKVAVHWAAMTTASKQNNTIQYNTIQYNTIQYNTIQYNTIQSS